MGKIYKYSDGSYYATEILSMGIENMVNYPKLLASHDPEFFDFIYDALRGVRWVQP
jgi:hypothetical protein